MAFETLQGRKSAPLGHDFKCKSRLVAKGHMTKAPARETARLTLIFSILSDLEVKLGDIFNAYVQAPVTEKVWTTLGPELIKDTRKNAVFFRALSSLKSARAALRSHLTRCMESLGYQSCMADLDL